MGSKKIFRTPLVNRPENGFLGGKKFLTPYFLPFLALSTRYLAIFSGSGGVCLTKISSGGNRLTIFRRKLIKKPWIRSDLTNPGNSRMYQNILKPHFLSPPQICRDWGQNYWGEAPKIWRRRRLFRKFWANFRKIVA